MRTTRAAGIATGAAVAQLVERVLGKDEVMGPSPISSFVRRTADDACVYLKHSTCPR
jgi:hypothetical protein